VHRGSAQELTTHRKAGEIEPEITQAKADPRFKSSKECASEHTTKSLEFCSSVSRPPPRSRRRWTSKPHYLLQPQIA
jgi:hypothetical protein